MSARPRVCIVIPSLHPGGTERQAVYLVQGLARDFAIDVVCTREAGAWAKDARPHADVFELGITSGWDYRQLGRLTKHFRARPADVVQTYLSGFDLAANVAARRAGVRVVVSSRRERATWKKARHVWLQRKANQYVDAIVANSIAVADYAAEQERTPRDRFTVIYNGAGALDPPPASDIRLELTIPRGAAVIGMVANFSEDKDHALFVAMAEQIRARRPDAHFVLAGNGPLRESVQRSVVSRGMGDVFRFIPTRANVFDLYPVMDVAVLTSKTEGFPNAVLEAMVSARPVVAAAVGGVPELIADGRTGRLVASRDPGDFASAVLELLDDARRAAEIGNRAAEHVRNHLGVEAMVDAHRDLYNRLLAAAQRGA